MSLHYELFTITYSEENPKPQLTKPKGYSSLSETDKYECEKLMQDCYSAACSGEKFIKIPEKISQEVLAALDIPKKAAIFYWDTPGTNNL